MSDKIPAEGPRSEGEAESLLTGEPLTLNYRPSPAASVLLASEDGRFPAYRMLREVEVMLVHPDVILPYGYFLSGIAEVRFKVRARTLAEAKFVHALYTKLWAHHLESLQRCYDYGWAAHELAYRLKGGYLHFDGIYDLHPLDVWALTWRGKYRGASLSGAVDGLERLQSGKMVLWGPGRWPAKGLWMSHNRRYNRFYGRSQLQGAWRPWRRLAGRDGLEEVIDGGIYRFAYSGPVIRYPTDSFKKKGGGASDIDYDAARERAREMAENYKAGIAIALPGDRDQKGEYKWVVERPEHVLDVAPLSEQERNVQKAISRGVGVPSELFEASDVGSGWSGRKIPLIGFYQSQVKCARNLVGLVRVQLAEPLLSWNYGRGAWCEVEPSIMIPEALSGEQGQAGQGGGQGPPEAQQPDAQGRIPYQGPKGGKGFKDPASGRVSYGEMSLAGEGEYTLAAGVTVTTGPGGETVVVDPRRGKSQARVEGQPPGGQDPWHAWTVRSGPRKGQQGWKNLNTGRIVVGEKPRQHAGSDTHDARGRQLGHRAAPLHERAKPEEVSAHVKGLLSDPSKITSDSIKETVEKMLSLRVKDIHEVKKSLDLKASGVKSELIRKVVERGLRLVPEKPKGEKRPQAKPEPQPSGAGKEPPPAKKAPAPPAPEEKPAKKDPAALEKEYRELGTRAPAFKSWFGDWEKDPQNASKVVNKATGEPQETHGTARKVFHGRRVKFDQFKKGRASVVGAGFYFAENPAVAKEFAVTDEGEKGEVLESYLSIKKPLDFDEFLSDEEVARWQAAIPDAPGREKFAAALDKLDADYRTDEPKNRGHLAWMALSKTVGEDKVNDVLAGLGYDGITHMTEDKWGTPNLAYTKDESKLKYGRCWIAFDNRQIKAAANKGTFDPSSANIYLSGG